MATKRTSWCPLASWRFNQPSEVYALPVSFFQRRVKGTINFASDYSDGGKIAVYSNGKMLGVLNEFLKAGQEPECGETHAGLSLAAEYWPHRYPYVAVAEDGTEWKGHFEIQSGGCETLVLSVE